MHVLRNWSRTSLSIVLRILRSGAGQKGEHKGLIIKEALTWKVFDCPPLLDLTEATFMMAFAGQI